MEDNVQDLIERLEAAEAGSAELDYLIDEVFSEWRNIGGGWAAHKVTDERRRNSFDYPDPVTSSLDAALELAERVLPGWVYMLVNDYCGYFRAELVRPESSAVTSVASTMPLALCIAILRAKQIDTASNPR